VLDTKSPKYLEMAQGHISLLESELEDHKWAQCVQGMAKRGLTHELPFYL
jgi:hypothetical protein